MKRDEKLIFRILERIAQSPESSGSIRRDETESEFRVSEDSFDFHARLLVSDGFVNGEFTSAGMIFYGLTTAGFDYYDRLKTPVRSFSRWLFQSSLLSCPKK